MKKFRYLYYMFAGLAVLLSNAMCAVVAYNYCSMQWGIRYACYSAPASVAFLLGVPYVIGIAICVMLSCFFRRKWQRSA